jgi:subtilisin family serine protease
MIHHPAPPGLTRSIILLLLFFLGFAPLKAGAANADRQPAGKIPDLVTEQLQAGQSADVIILFDTTETENEIISLRKSRNVVHDDAPILARRALRYREQKKAVLDKLPPNEAEILRDYSHLPMTVLRLRSLKQLDQLAGRADIIAIYADQPIYPHLTQSLPLIEQPTAASVGYTGTGATMAILDTGVNWNHSAFGSCTAPGAPSTCKVAMAVEIATDDGSTQDSSGHGSNVAATALGVAPGARIAALDVFNPDGTSTDSLIISAINWTITNKTAYNIVSLNMSLGDGGNHTSLCSKKITNPYVTPITNARAAGILPVASSGNDGYTGGIASPACTPGIVSVGAVYDADLGSLSWSACTDSTTAADKVTCFSNSASFLTMLAPGAIITAAGLSYGGTSQAAPHVAGAIAVLRAEWPEETLDTTQNRMTTEGISITDSRNGLIFPRLSLTGALQLPPEDLFAEPADLSGGTGTTSATNTTATKETGEPDHAGNSGGHSLWWTWTAPASGDYSFYTTDSDFDTLLAVYQGTTVSDLTLIAANDDADSTAVTSCLVFNAVAGEEYRIVVDGKGGTSGAVSLQWESIPENTDIPMLPPWGVAGMGIMMSAVATLIQHKNRRDKER